MKNFLREGNRSPFFLFLLFLFLGTDAAVAQCTLTANITNVTCSNMGTSDPTDDKYSFTITVSVSGGSGGGFWSSSSPEVASGGYDTPKDIVKQFKISAGNQTFTVTSGDGACSVPVTVTPPASCSPPCNWTPATGSAYASSTIVRDGKGTPDPNDDTVSGMFTVTGVPPGEMWSLSRKLDANDDHLKDHIGDYPSTTTTVPWGPVPVTAAYPGQNGFVLWFMTNSVTDCLGDIFVMLPDPPSSSCTPPTNVSASSNGSLNTGSTVNLNVTSSGGTRYEWAGPDGFSSTQQNPSFSASTTAKSGVYTVTVTSTGTCTATATTSVGVTEAPSRCTDITNLSASISPTSIAVGSSATLNASGSGLSGSTVYSWTGTGGFSSNTQSPSTGTINTAGGYSYYVTASNTTGTGTCTASASTSLTVTAAASSCTISASASNITCANMTTSDPSDDRYSFNMTVSISGGSGGGFWSSPTPELASGTYNTPKFIDKQFTIASGTRTFTVNSGDGQCSTTFSVTPPATCSPPCFWTPANGDSYATYTITRDTKGTSDPNDDTVSGTFTLTGIPAGEMWSLSRKLTASGNGADHIGDYPSTTTTVPWGPVPVTAAYPGQNGFVLWFMLNSVTDCLGDIFVTIPEPACTTISNLVASISPTSIVTGNSATLNVTGTGLSGSTTFSWSGTGGFSSNNQSPSTGTINTAGGYTYSVTASNSVGTGVCTASATVSLTVSTATSPCTPISNLSASVSPTSIGVGNAATLNVTGTGVVASSSGFSWSGSNGFSSNSQSPSTGTINTPGGYSYSVTVINANGSGVCTASATTSLTVTAAACTTLSNLTATATPTSMATGNASSLNVTGTGITFGITTFSWAGTGGFASSNQNPSTGTLNSAGGYSYSVTATNANGTGVCTASATVSLTVSTASTPCTPITNLVATVTPTSMATGNSATLNVTGTGVTAGVSSFSWFEPTTGFTATTQSPSTGIINTAGGYTYVVRVGNSNGTGVCTASTTVSLTVSVATSPCTPITNLVATATPTSMATGNAASLNVTGTGITAGTTTFSWAGTGGFSSNTQNPSTGTINTAGGYSYSVTATNANGTGVCTASATTSLTVSAGTTCSVSATLTQSVCQDNGTTSNTQAGDDYFNITVLATATSGGVSNQFEVVLNANADGTGGNVQNPGGTTYGQSVTINGLGKFQANGTSTYTITIRDKDTPTCKTTRTTAVVFPCSGACPPQLCAPTTVQKN